jgi:hypothetical protein
MPASFAELVKKHFDFLLKDYGFKIVQADKYKVVFQSRALIIEIMEDRGSVLDWIGQVSSPKIRYNTLLIADFLAGGVSSHIRIHDFKENVQVQVGLIADAMRQHLAPILREEFTQWEELDEFRRKCIAEGEKAMKGIRSSS